MPRENPPGPGFDRKDLEPIARKAARLWPYLAPLGGWFWTDEDVDSAVSTLYGVTGMECFLRAYARGMTRPQVRAYLLKALRHRLLKHATGSRRREFWEDLLLDALPAPCDEGGGLDRDDRATFVGRVLAELTAEERATAADYFRGDGVPVNQSRAERTRQRHRARLREVLRAVVRDAGLTREEAADLVAALAAKLTGGGDP